ncbi:MAG: hypothetical protein IT428_19005 [Planctomycetaceae bacterium]|nr:hypothetical protein [Planctomycetaceae bacterium]
MKAVIAIVLAIALMLFLGWMTVQKSGDRTTVTIETQKMKDDTEQALEKGRTAAEKAGRKTRAAIDQTEEEVERKSND